MKVIIAGGRDFNDYDILHNFCDKMLANCTNIEIVSRTAKGADKLGEIYAKNKCYDITRFRPNWDLYGKCVGYTRNIQMSEYVDVLIAFWNRNSKGTEHMFNIMKSLNKKTRICYY